MSVTYDPVHWTPHKKLYDRLLLAFAAVYLVLFGGMEWVLHPQVTVETLVIRATGTLAFLMLHLILCIGPLCRIDRRFLPLLYNRRHFGVTMFLVAAIHGIFNLVQFHGQGNVDPLLSLFTSNTHYDSIVRFPFQAPGFFALLILFVMAATSHDFWLKNLKPPVWKALHTGVYAAYALLVMHVMLGVIQLEKSPVLVGLTGLGVFAVTGLHVAAASVQMRRDRAARVSREAHASDGFVYICLVTEIPDKRAKICLVNGENIAIFKYDGKVSAIHNLCKHQNGPLGEGRIIDGCITCPWHGYQYRPEDGQSPPPFTEKVCTYDVRVAGGKVYVNPKPYPEGTARPPASIVEG